MGETRPHAPAVVRPLIALAGRIGPPVRGSASLRLSLIGIAEIGSGVVVEIVVGSQPKLVPIRGRRSGKGQIVGHVPRLLRLRVVTEQLCADSIRDEARKVGENVARYRIADEAGLSSRTSGLGIDGASRYGAPAVRVVNLAGINGSAESVCAHRSGSQLLGEVAGPEAGVWHRVLRRRRLV